MKTANDIRPAPVMGMAVATVMLTVNFQKATSAVTIDNTVRYDSASGTYPRGVAPDTWTTWAIDPPSSPIHDLSSGLLPNTIRDRIMSFARPDNMYTDGAAEISDRACQATIAFLERAISRLPGQLPKSVSPSVKGAIAIHWVNGDKQILIQISSTRGRAYYQYETPDGGYEYGTDTRENLLQKLSTVFA